MTESDHLTKIANELAKEFNLNLSKIKEGSEYQTLLMAENIAYQFAIDRINLSLIYLHKPVVSYGA